MIPARVLKQARRRAGYTQRQLAEKVGMPQSTIGRIESGALDPRATTLDKLLRACGDELRAVPRIGEGVDRTLAWELLAQPPEERLRSMVQASRNLMALQWRQTS